MNKIEQMLTGQMEISEFLDELASDQKLQMQIRKLVPIEAIDNPDHVFWTRIYYGSVKRFDYDYLQFLEWMCRFDGTIGDKLNIWATLRRAYCYHYPEIICTEQYEKAHSLYLDAVRDCFEGFEVQSLIEDIVIEALQIKQKGKRVQQVKQKLNKLFRSESGKYPRWIQGAEWPMGTNVPMMFVKQIRTNDAVCYYFEDVDTRNIRVIEQYY